MQIVFIVLLSIIAVGGFVGWAYWEQRYVNLAIKHNEFVAKHGPKEN